MPAKRDPLLEQALLEGATKYGPQGNALRALLSELAGSYTRTRRTNASNAAGIAAATRQARPDVASAFDQALASSSAQRAALGVGPAEAQAAAYERRVGEQRANALGELTERELRATEGRVYANQAARDEYQAGKAKLIGQLRELAGQQGAETAVAYGKAKEAQRARALTVRGQDITARGQDIASRDRREAARREAAKAKRAPKIKLASQEQHAKARDLIEEAVAQVRDLRQDTGSRAEIIALLVKGVPASKLPDGTAVPPIPKLPPDFVRAATNLVFDGTLSRGDVARLHNRRLRIRSLGYPTRKGRAAPRSAAQLAATGRPSMSARPPVPGLTR